MNSKRKAAIKKLSFSLLELMLAFLILALLGGVAYINVKASIDERRAKNVIQQIDRTFRTASLLARMIRNDVVVLIEEGAPVTISISKNIAVPDAKKQLFGKKEPLEKVHRVLLAPERRNTHCLEIVFLPYEVQPHEGTFTVHFESGFTHVFRLNSYIENISEITNSGEIAAIFPQEVLHEPENKKVIQPH